MIITQGVGLAGDLLSKSGQGQAGASVDPLYGAVRVVYRPEDYTGGIPSATYGHYRLRVATSAAAFTNGVVLANFRWAPTPATLLAILYRIQIETYVVTAVTAQRADPILVKIARAYTASESSNNSNATLTGNNGKLRTNMGTTQVAQIASASAAAGMSGGSSTLDTQAIAEAPCSGSVGLIGLGTGLGNVDAWNTQASGEHPIVLANNEGVQVLWGTTTLATGTVIVAVTYSWAEVVSY